jgi:hypothetical protein
MREQITSALLSCRNGLSCGSIDIQQIGASIREMILDNWDQIVACYI